MSAITTPWEGYVKPFRIYGNLYFVGTVPASTHLIDTGEGLIMIDSGYPQSLYLVLAGMQDLGFSYHDVKYIVHSHGHYDHLGATKALVALTNAKTFLGAPDATYANGTEDLTWAKELGADYYEAFEPDVLLHDGDTITLGHTVIECVATPGHTPGTMSFFFNAIDNGVKKTCAMFGGFGFNSMESSFLDLKGLSHDCRKDFLASLAKVRDRHVDIALGNHVGNNDTVGKSLRMTPEYNPFVDDTAWGKMLDAHKKMFLEHFGNAGEKSL